MINDKTLCSPNPGVSSSHPGSPQRRTDPTRRCRAAGATASSCCKQFSPPGASSAPMGTEPTAMHEELCGDQAVHEKQKWIWNLRGRNANFHGNGWNTCNSYWVMRIHLAVSFYQEMHIAASLLSPVKNNMEKQLVLPNVCLKHNKSLSGVFQMNFTFLKRFKAMHSHGQK